MKTQNDVTRDTDFVSSSANAAILEHLMAGGEVVPCQMGVRSDWSAEKRLAGAVLSSALVEIRDHCGDRGFRRRVQQDLEWVASDDTEWPYSFVRLCQLFDLDPEWVRGIVRRWQRVPSKQGLRTYMPYRNAA